MMKTIKYLWIAMALAAPPVYAAFLKLFPFISTSFTGPLSNQSLEPDERQETIIEAKVQEQKTEQNPIFVDTSKPKVCPKCGTKLAPTATTCFLCGTKLL